jgi:spore photoproduct lyase
MPGFVPRRVFFEQAALDYPLGKKIYDMLREQNIELKIIGSHNRVTGIPGKTPLSGYIEAKRTLVVGVRRSLKFETCKPSAHYQLPLVTSCPGMCEYCYLNTTLGKKPYIRVYVNIDEILERAGSYIRERAPEVTVFEGAATSDPLPVEPWTGALRQVIGFFGREEHGRFRFVTKFSEVNGLLDVRHNGHTRFRFSLNTDYVINKFEKGTPPLAERIAAAARVAGAAYPLGFIIAPILVYKGWQEEYTELFRELQSAVAYGVPADLTFEFITHRFTARAKTNILHIFPETKLPMDEEERRFKFGQFGYGKYIYPQDVFAGVQEHMYKLAGEFFPQARVEYFV